MRIVALVQARMGSSRLPGKSLMALQGRPLLSHVLERVKAAPLVHEVVLATSVSDRDSALLAVAASCGVRTWRGSEWDVLERMAGAAVWARADAVVRITADCPLLAPDLIARAVQAYEEAGDPLAFALNDTLTDGYPDGTDVEVFSREQLVLASSRALRRQDREHVTPFIRQAASRFLRLKGPSDWSHVKLSVDKAEDLERVMAVMAALPYHGGYVWADTEAALRRLGYVARGEAAV